MHPRFVASAVLENCWLRLCHRGSLRVPPKEIDRCSAGGPPSKRRAILPANGARLRLCCKLSSLASDGICLDWSCRLARNNQPSYIFAVPRGCAARVSHPTYRTVLSCSPALLPLYQGSSTCRRSSSKPTSSSSSSSSNSSRRPSGPRPLQDRDIRREGSCGTAHPPYPRRRSIHVRSWQSFAIPHGTKRLRSFLRSSLCVAWGQGLFA